MATLLVSELVTNTVLHAKSGVRLLVRLHGTTLRVEVRDASTAFATRRHFGEEAGTGRGLLLVEELAERWGCELEPLGKVTWFELSVNGWP